MLLEANKVNTPIKADPEEEKKILDFNRRFADEEEIGESRCDCMFDDEVDFDEIDGESRDFDEIEDPRQVCSCIFLFFETKQVLLNLLLI